MLVKWDQTDHFFLPKWPLFSKKIAIRCFDSQCDNMKRTRAYQIIVKKHIYFFIYLLPELV